MFQIKRTIKAMFSSHQISPKLSTFHQITLHSKLSYSHKLLFFFLNYQLSPNFSPNSETKHSLKLDKKTHSRS